jgi:hypothetical protein
MNAPVHRVFFPDVERIQMKLVYKINAFVYRLVFIDIRNYSLLRKDFQIDHRSSELANINHQLLNPISKIQMISIVYRINLVEARPVRSVIDRRGGILILICINY